MGAEESIEPEVTDRASGVSFKTLGLIAGSILVGAAGAILVLRGAAGGLEAVSVLSLLGFFLMVVLAVAAMTLSGVAISLSRLAERTVSQNAAQNNPVPQADEPPKASPTDSGVPLSEQLANLRNEIRADIEMAVHDALTRAATEPALDVVDPNIALEEALARAETKYTHFKDIVLLGVANYPGVQPLKVGEGHYRTTGDDLADGVFKLNHERVAVCTFAGDHPLNDRFFGEQGDRFSGFLRSLLEEIKKGHFSRVLLVFNRVLDSNSPYAKALNVFSVRVDSETFAQFELFEGSPEIVIPELTERVSQLMQLEPKKSRAVSEEQALPAFSFRTEQTG